MSSYLIYNNQYLQYSGQYMNYTNFFNIGVGFNDLVRTLAIDSNNKIYVGGDFTTYKNVSENHIIRLNSDGTKDASFDAGTGFNSNVRKIKIDFCAMA